MHFTMMIAFLDSHLSKCAIISAEHVSYISNEPSSKNPNIIYRRYMMQRSFALNPITNKLELIYIPADNSNLKQTQNGHNKDPSNTQNGKSKHNGSYNKMDKEVPRLKMERNGDKNIESIKLQRTGKELEEVKDLNDLLTDIILSTAEQIPHNFQSMLDGILSQAKQYPLDLLVMMDYTQKLSYLRHKCTSWLNLVSKFSSEITRITQLLFNEQQRQFSRMCSHWLTDSQVSND